MPARVQWDGLDELKAWLRTLPAHLTQEASAIVYSHARAAQQDVQAGYPVVTGSLRANVRVTIDAQSRYGARAIVRSAAPHAHLFEYGNKNERFYTGTDKLGRVFKNATRGYMRKGPNIKAPEPQRAGPKFARWKVRMWAQLAAMMERNGLKVSGSIGR